MRECRLKSVLVSIVLPAYNEADRIESTLRSLARFRQDCGFDTEVIAVDDGSADDTIEVLRRGRGYLPDMTIAHHLRNRGKGGAVQTGMSLARGDFRAFFDADEATPFDALHDLLRVAVAAPSTVAIGSVRAPGANVEMPQSRLRSWAGRAGNAVVQASVLPGIADTQRGCKLFPADIADVAFGALVTQGWAFDIEVLALCKRLGYDVVEVPVTWRHVDGGQVKVGAYSETLKNVARIRRILRNVEPSAPLSPSGPMLPIGVPARRPA